MDHMARQSAASVRAFTSEPERDRDICPAGKERVGIVKGNDVANLC
jgi:hypothetical protein